MPERSTQQATLVVELNHAQRAQLFDLMEKYTLPLLNFARLFVRSREEAEDLVGAFFEKLGKRIMNKGTLDFEAKARERLQEIPSPEEIAHTERSYVFRGFYNFQLDSLEHEEIEREIFGSRVFASGEGNTSEFDPFETAHSTEFTEDDIVGEIVGNALTQQIHSQLSAEHKLLFTYILAGFTCEELTRMLKISPRELRSKIGHMRERSKILLAQAQKQDRMHFPLS